MQAASLTIRSGSLSSEWPLTISCCLWSTVIVYIVLLEQLVEEVKDELQRDLTLPFNQSSEEVKVLVFLSLLFLLEVLIFVVTAILVLNSTCSRRWDVTFLLKILFKIHSHKLVDYLLHLVLAWDFHCLTLLHNSLPYLIKQGCMKFERSAWYLKTLNSEGKELLKIAFKHSISYFGEISHLEVSLKWWFRWYDAYLKLLGYADKLLKEQAILKDELLLCRRLQ